MKQFFNKLEELYPWLGWWPITPKNEVTPIYSKSKKILLTNENKFEILVGAILTQNTSWNNVIKAIQNLKKLKILSPENFLNQKKNIVIQAIKSSGYFNQKYKKLFILCEFLEKNSFENLEKYKTIELREKFLGLWGIGKETADSMVLYAFNKKIFVVDTYTRRILSRNKLIEENLEYDEIRILIEKNIPNSLYKYKNYHAAIVEICKTNCKKKPLCDGCVFK